MLNRPHPPLGRLVLFLLVALLLATTAACADVPVNQAVATAASVRDQAATLRPSATRDAPASPTIGAKATRTRLPTATPSDNLATITLARLPREARETIRLIQQGGPFPFDKDGATFGNREGLLPKRPNGYYREYTVITPGSRDRGARRIVAGQGGELYYTGDHYDSFKRVTP